MHFCPCENVLQNVNKTYLLLNANVGIPSLYTTVYTVHPIIVPFRKPLADIANPSPRTKKNPPLPDCCPVSRGLVASTHQNPRVKRASSESRFSHALPPASDRTSPRRTAAHLSTKATITHLQASFQRNSTTRHSRLPW